MEKPRPLADVGHLIGVLGVLGGAIAYQGISRHLAGPAAPGDSEPHYQSAAGALLLSMAFEWGLLAYIWAGVRGNGRTLLEVIGGRWRNWKQVALDFAIALPFWGLWTATARFVWWLLGPPAPQRGPFQFPPQGWLDISLWFLVSLTAGFCEEIIYRGYLQKQFHALTGSAGLALVIQALLFGISHLYQGNKPVIVISVLGLLYGALAQWRHNLRAAMISHAWSDLFEGYFKHVWRLGL
jgi:uncharacterized protein